MTRYDRPTQALAACLCALAGYVDAIGFIQLGGFFVSFMSGNSTRLAVGMARQAPNQLVAAALIGGFLAGVIGGSIAGRLAKARRRFAVLAVVTMALVCAAIFGQLHRTSYAVTMMTLAMGAENAVFEEGGEVRIGLTYMTGTLVKVGQRIAAAMLGGDRLAWVPYLLLWASLILGAAAGAKAYSWFGLGGLWLGAGAAALLMIGSIKRSPRPPEPT